MKKILLFLVSLFVGIGLFFWIGRTVGWGEVKNSLSIFTGWHGIVILILTALSVVAGAWKCKEILKGQGIGNISFKEIFKAYIASYSLAYLAPIIVFGSEILRAYILKEKKLITWKMGIASVTIDRISEWTINLITIAFAILYFFLKEGSFPKDLGMISVGLFILFAVVIGYFYIKVYKRESIFDLICNWFGIGKTNNGNSIIVVEKEVFDFFKRKNRPMWNCFGISIIKAFINYLRVFLLIIFLGKKISVIPSIAILGLTYLAAIIPIPAALGTHEAIQIFAFNSLGLGSSTATAFTMIIRGAELVVAFVGLAFLVRFWLWLLKKIFLDKVEKVVEENGLAE